MGALSVWETQTGEGNRKQSVKGKLIHASQLYYRIKNVIKLTEVKRQNDADFITFLNNLRDGIVTTAQWEWVSQRCSEEAIVTRMGRAWFNNKFWTGDGQNSSRAEGDPAIKSGLIGSWNKLQLSQILLIFSIYIFNTLFLHCWIVPTTTHCIFYRNSVFVFSFYLLYYAHTVFVFS